MEEQINIEKSKPPYWIWAQVHKRFEIDDINTIYTYGNTIYDPRPTDEKLSASVIVHEMEHMKQQLRAGGPDAWWWKYLTDPKKRLEYEIEAYRVQYKHACTVYRDRNDQARYLHLLATFASSEMYQMGITYQQALKSIRQ